tara:strand:+ start:24374 stop:24901 length:528 start_codon:yes stop_codon:yes gene_type:complete
MFFFPPFPSSGGDHHRSSWVKHVLPQVIRLVLTRNVTMVENLNTDAIVLKEIEEETEANFAMPLPPAGTHAATELYRRVSFEDIYRKGYKMTSLRDSNGFSLLLLSRPIEALARCPICLKSNHECAKKMIMCDEGHWSCGECERNVVNIGSCVLCTKPLAIKYKQGEPRLVQFRP